MSRARLTSRRAGGDRCGRGNGSRLQGAGELGYRVEAISGRLGECALQCGGDIGGHRRTELGDRRRIRDKVLMDDALDGRPGEGRLTRQHFIEDAAEGVEIAAAVEIALTGGLLRTHVPHGPERHPRLGELLAAGGTDRPGNPKVRNHGVSAFEQDVFRLDVAVDHVVRMGIAERVGHLAGDLERVLDRELLLAVEPVPEGLALDEGHDVIQQSWVVGRERRLDDTAVEEWEDVRVAEVRRGLDFAEEALGAECGGEFGAEDLDGDLAVVLQVLGEVDGWPCHPGRARARCDSGRTARWRVGLPS